MWFSVLPEMSPALPGLSPALPGAPRHVVSAPRYSEARQECPPRLWYSPEIDASKFTLQILSDTPGGFQWLKYILLMLCNATDRLGDRKHVTLSQRVRGCVRAVRAVRNTRVFLTETRVVADACPLIRDAANRVYPDESTDEFRDESRYTVPIQWHVSIYNWCRHFCPSISLPRSFVAALWCHRCELKMNLHLRR